MSLATTTGAITNIAYLGFTLGTLGLALNFTQRAFDQVPDYRGRTRQSPPIMDMNMPKKSKKNGNGYGYGFYGGNQDYSNQNYGFGSYGNGKKKQSLNSDDMFDISRYF